MADETGTDAELEENLVNYEVLSPKEHAQQLSRLYHLLPQVPRSFWREASDRARALLVEHRAEMTDEEFNSHPDWTAFTGPGKSEELLRRDEEYLKAIDSSRQKKVFMENVDNLLGLAPITDSFRQLLRSEFSGKYTKGVDSEVVGQNTLKWVIDTFPAEGGSIFNEQLVPEIELQALERYKLDLLARQHFFETLREARKTHIEIKKAVGRDTNELPPESTFPRLHEGEPKPEDWADQLLENSNTASS